MNVSIKKLFLDYAKKPTTYLYLETVSFKDFDSSISRIGFHRIYLSVILNI